MNNERDWRTFLQDFIAKNAVKRVATANGMSNIFIDGKQLTNAEAENMFAIVLEDMLKQGDF